ncbi:MAG TPA: bifunctional diaminohydroxyphosphoribosylaminopyrimidine deaminase/5-amino-6-(5-phosphoribosylamino)uracil reductase RibD [Sphingobacteriaceae bacterium]|nr:bifunctional diaminohydroxyphosphoribosylaminopyrimidine deaminase/5-amino-6-(5-phosphoribosylamino)uracil reductase RibD [Sphingobacteriaceae bacterium]
MPEHELYMQRCLELANRGAGYVSPNPLVGAVIVCDGKIIGEGYHQKHGEAHAEVNAIQSVINSHSNAEEILKRSSIYVNLEPCAHFGKTPPCADLIIRYKIPKVIIGCRDPFEQVNGKGLEKLENAGIEVITDLLKKECLDLNKRFFTRINKQRPYIILKWAQTSNGFFAPADGSQKWISSPEAKRLVHRWRAEEDAVLVGKNTALSDNPQLNVRKWKGKNPVRIVIDRHLQLPQHLHLFDRSQDTIVFNEIKTEITDKIKYLQPDDFDNYLPQMIAYQLYILDIQSLIVEGGAQTLDLFIKAGMWDEARVFINTEEWSDGIKAPQLSFSAAEKLKIGTDTLMIQYNTL